MYVELLNISIIVRVYLDNLWSKTILLSMHLKNVL